MTAVPNPRTIQVHSVAPAAAAIALDFPAVLGVTLLAAIVYPLANLVVDIAYFWLDPRTQRG